MIFLDYVQGRCCNPSLDNYVTSVSLCRTLQRCPLPFVTSPLSATISQCALAAATLNHRDAFSSVMKYLRDLLLLPKDDTLVKPLVMITGAV